MSTQGGREPVRGTRRRRNLDLNVPPIEIREQEGPSVQAGMQGVQASQQGQTLPPATIDVEAIDDDVIESSPRAFAEAKNKRNRARDDVIVVESAERVSRFSNNNRNRRRRISSKPIINCELINLESSSTSTIVAKQCEPQKEPMPPPPPKEITFTCPICMGPFVEEMSTKCGHIFCKACIKAAIAAQAKCPTCRKRITVRELIRVFLPAASSS